jgi:MFS family permease
MAVCVAALMLLSIALTGMGARVHSIMISLAVFGAGLGMFIAPNNSSTMDAAPRARSGEAGGLLNLMRILGTSLGVAAASAILSWRLAVLTGIGDRTLTASEQALLGGVRDGLLLLVAFAVIASVTSALRAPPRAPALKATA